MAADGDEIGQTIADELSAPLPVWQVVGNAVAGYLSRAVWYLDSTPALVGASPAQGVVVTSATATAPATMTAAMAVGAPSLAVWPAQQMILHLWTQALNMPSGYVYGVQVTLQQVNAAGAVVATIGHRQQAIDPYYTGDIAATDWCETVLPWPQPQTAVDTETRLQVVLEILTTCPTAVVVNIGIGGWHGTNIDTSLVAGGGSGGGGPSTDRLVVADDQPSAVAGALDQVLASDGSIVFSLMPGGSPLPVVTLAALPIPESDVTNLVTDLAGKVSTATTVNGHALTGPISLTAADVGADAAGAAAAITLAGLGGVPTTRQVAGHALSADVTITAADVGADPAGSAAAITLAGLGGVPTSRTINTHALTGNLSLTAADVGADAAGAAAAITLAGLGGIPTSQKGAASGVATLDTNTLVPVTQLPTGTSLAKGALQLGTTTGTACDGADSRLSNARTANAILETSGPTTLTVGAVSDGQFLKRSGATVIGAAASGGSVALSLYTSMMLG